MRIDTYIHTYIHSHKERLNSDTDIPGASVPHGRRDSDESTGRGILVAARRGLSSNPSAPHPISAMSSGIHGCKVSPFLGKIQRGRSHVTERRQNHKADDSHENSQGVIKEKYKNAMASFFWGVWGEPGHSGGAQGQLRCGWGCPARDAGPAQGKTNPPNKLSRSSALPFCTDASSWKEGNQSRIAEQQ